MTTHTPWWRHATVYQIYVRSFADSNADGTGDIDGIRSRLGYLRDLGVDAIWVNPWYRSPLADGGYDVADYRDIEPRYGTLADAEALIAEAHDHGIRVIADLVPNHTSDQHVWFQEAVASPPGHPNRARYHIRPGKNGGSRPPTNWHSVFGGPAWTRLDDGEWYLHLFDATQPDLNWEHPEVRAEFEDILRFWLDRGIDGFRVDVAHGMSKDMSFPDLKVEPGVVLSSAAFEGHPFWDRDGIHEIVRGWRRVLDEYAAAANIGVGGEQPRERMMVAEAWVRPGRIARYTRPDEYHQSFDFEFLQTDWDAGDLREAITESLGTSAAVGSTPTWVLSNHDVMRHATRYGLPLGTDWRAWPIEGPVDALDAELGLRRARAAALLVLALPGSLYLYQGEELGLPDVWDLPPEVLDDPVFERSSGLRKGRDGCRVPIPWTTEGPSLGFGGAEPWLPQPAVFAQLAVAAQTGVAGSMLELYRTGLAIRRDELIGDEDLVWLEAPSGVLAFERGSGVQCWVNVSSGSLALPAGAQVLLTSAAGDGAELATDTAAWLRVS